MSWHRNRLIVCWLCLGLCSLSIPACSSAKSKSMVLRVKDQDVPVVVAIGPFDVQAVKYDGEPVSGDIQGSIQEAFRAALKNTGVFKEVKILQIDKQAVPDSESILALARDQHADLLITGEAKEFQAAIGTPFPKSQYEIQLRFLTQLYNVHSRRLGWKKLESAQVTRSEWRGDGKLKEIIDTFVIPSIVAGTIAPMVNNVQTVYAHSAGQEKAVAAEEASTSIFGGAELAKIDAELDPPTTRMPLPGARVCCSHWSGKLSRFADGRLCDA